MVVKIVTMIIRHVFFFTKNISLKEGEQKKKKYKTKPRAFMPNLKSTGLLKRYIQLRGHCT